MPTDEKNELLIEAEAKLSSATEIFVRLLGSERGQEVAIGFIEERVRTLAARRKVVLSLVREAVQ